MFESRLPLHLFNKLARLRDNSSACYLSGGEGRAPEATDYKALPILDVQPIRLAFGAHDGGNQKTHGLATGTCRAQSLDNSFHVWHILFVDYAIHVMSMAEKGERLREFLMRLAAAAPCRNHNDAFNLVRNTLTGVEDELTHIPNDPDVWQTDGRMYPPKPDSERKSPFPGVRRFRSRKHYTDIGYNGAIRISTVEGAVVLINKPGIDGKQVNEL